LLHPIFPKALPGHDQMPDAISNKPAAEIKVYLAFEAGCPVAAGRLSGLRFGSVRACAVVSAQ
jgi:hypothetical protein